MVITQVYLTNGKNYIYGTTPFTINIITDTPVYSFTFGPSCYNTANFSKSSSGRDGYKIDATFAALSTNNGNFILDLTKLSMRPWPPFNSYVYYGTGTFEIPWYATDPYPTDPGTPTGDQSVVEYGPTVLLSGYPQFLASGAMTPFNVTINFNEAIYAFNTATEFIVTNAVQSSGTLTQSSPTIWTVTVTPSGAEPVGLFVPSNVATSVVTGFTNNCSDIILLTTQPAPTPVLTVPSSRSDYATANQPYTISIDFGMVVYGFSTNDLTLTNATATVTGGTSGIFTATITPSGGNPISYFIASGVCSNSAGKGNIQSDTYYTTYSYTQAPGIGGSETTGTIGVGGILGGASGTWGNGQVGNGIMAPTSSGEFTATYLNAFNDNGTVIQLVHFAGIANTTSGAIGNVSPYPIGWANAIPGTGMMYGEGYFTPNYASGVPYLSYAFLDFNQQALDINYSVKKSLNKNQVYATDVDKGRIYLPPNIYLTLSESEVHVTTDGNQWAKSWDLVVRDVWIILYNDFMWHLVMPKPRYIGNDLCFIETDIIKCGVGYNPWSFFYQKGTAHPIDVTTGMVRGHAMGGWMWPVDGGVY